MFKFYGGEKNLPRTESFEPLSKKCAELKPAKCKKNETLSQSYKRKTGISPCWQTKTSIRRTIMDYGQTKDSQVLPLPGTTYYIKTAQTLYY